MRADGVRPLHGTQQVQKGDSAEHEWCARAGARERETNERRAVGGGRRVTGEISRAFVCVWKKELELKLSQLNVRSRARVGSQ